MIEFDIDAILASAESIVQSGSYMYSKNASCDIVGAIAIMIMRDGMSDDDRALLVAEAAGDTATADLIIDTATMKLPSDTNALVSVSLVSLEPNDANAWFSGVLTSSDSNTSGFRSDTSDTDIQYLSSFLPSSPDTQVLSEYLCHSRHYVTQGTPDTHQWSIDLDYEEASEEGSEEASEEEGGLPIHVSNENSSPTDTELGSSVTGVTRQKQPEAMPTDVAYAEIQVWHNQVEIDAEIDVVAKPQGKSRGRGKGGTKTEWMAKVRSASAESIGGDAMNPIMQQHFLSFAPGGPRRFKHRIKRLVAMGRLSQSFLDYVDTATKTISRDSWMALVSKSAIEGDKPAPGQSSKARNAFDYQWAVLTLNPDKTAPAQIELHLEADAEPICVTVFRAPPAVTKTGTKRKTKASHWLAYHDPYDVHLGARHDAEAAKASRDENAGLINFHPQTQISKMVMDLLMPLHERIVEMEAGIPERVADLEYKLADTLARIRALEGGYLPNGKPRPLWP